MAGTCSTCGSELVKGFRFCGNCGSPQLEGCESCGTVNPPGFRFCGGCGRPLVEVDLTSIAPAEERKVATVVFADVVGFTTLAEETDAEEVGHAVDAAFRTVGDIVAQHGGVIHSYLGDGVMAIFGVPQAHDDDAERAVAAALGITRVTDGGLSFSCGVNTGELVVIPVGLDAKPSILGDTVNVAARLEKLAGAGEVLVGPVTAQLARHRVALTRRKPTLVKGRTTPVEVWEATGLKSVGARPSAPAPPLVGRHDELAFLHSAWHRVCDEQRPTLVLLTGEPGVGKTRLADEVSAGAEQEGARVVRVTYPALGGLGGPRVGASVVRQLGMTGDPDVDNRIRSVAGEDVAALAELDPQALLAEQSFAFLKLVESKAAEQPLVIVIDDTHRSTGRLLELVSTVSNRLRAAPVMVVMVGRNEGMWLNAFASPTVLRIDPLGRAASAELVRALAPALTEGDPDLIDTIVERAGGNPLFLRELAGAADVGGTLPPTLQAILAARVDALAPPVKLALQHVAVFGGGVVPSQIAALGPATVATHLDTLLQRGLLRADGSDQLSVADSLLAEVAYEMLPRHVRAERHRAAAKIVTSPQERARHLYKAAKHEPDDEKLQADAQTALVAAAIEALDKGRTPEGQRLIELALERGGVDPDVLLRLAQELANGFALSDVEAVLSHLPSDLDERQAAEALHIRGLSLVGTDYKESVRLLGEAGDRWRRLGDFTKLAWARANQSMALMSLSQPDDAADALEEAAERFEKTGDEIGLSAVYRLLHLVRPDDQRVPVWLSQTVVRAEEAGDRMTAASALSGLMWWRVLRSRLGPPEVVASTEANALRLVELSREVGDWFNLTHALCIAAILARQAGRFEDARCLVDQVLDVETPDESAETAVKQITQFAVALVSDPKVVVPPAPSNHLGPVGQAAGIFRVESVLLAGRGEEIADGGDHLVEGPKLGELGDLIGSLARGWVRLVGGNLEGAVTDLEKVGTLGARLGWGPGQAMGGALLAEARLRLGDEGAARAALVGLAPDGRLPEGGIAGVAVMRARVLLGEDDLLPALEQACERLAVPGLLP